MVYKAGDRIEVLDYYENSTPIWRMGEVLDPVKFVPLLNEYRVILKVDGSPATWLLKEESIRKPFLEICKEALL